MAGIKKMIINVGLHVEKLRMRYDAATLENGLAVLQKFTKSYHITQLIIPEK